MRIETPVRAISEVARECLRDWDKPSVYAAPYLDAMLTLGNIRQSYFQDSAASVVLYFLSNATTWRGATARRCKAELNAMLKSERGGQCRAIGPELKGKKMTTTENSKEISAADAVEAAKAAASAALAAVVAAKAAVRDAKADIRAAKADIRAAEDAEDAAWDAVKDARAALVAAMAAVVAAEDAANRA